MCAMESMKGSESLLRGSRNTSNYSQWLQATLSELDEKAKEMLKLIEEDGDTFAQRAEMYYKKRPELIKMVYDFHKLYRSLAERHDQYSRQESARINHSGFQFDHPVDVKECKGNASNADPTDEISDKPSHIRNKHAVDDLLPSEASEMSSKENFQIDGEKEKDGIKGKLDNDASDIICQDIGDQKAATLSSQDRESMWANLKLQVSKLMEDNLRQQSELIKRNDEKRQAIKELSFHLDKVMDENKTLEYCLRSSRSGGVKRKQSQLSKLKAMILRKFISA